MTTASATTMTVTPDGSGGLSVAYTPPSSGGSLPSAITAVLTNWNPSTQGSGAATALARVTGGTGRMTVAFVGDSTTAGVGSTVGTDGQRYHSTASHCAADIAGHANTAVSGVFNNAVGYPFETMSSTDTHQTTTGAATYGGATLPGGQCMYFDSTGSIVYTPAVAYDHIRVTYVKCASFTVTFGSTTSPTAAANDSSFNMATQTWAAGSVITSAITLTGTASGTFNEVMSIECWNSTASKIECVNFGIGGAYSTSLNSSTTGPNYDAGLVAEVPDVCFIMFGINDGNGSSGFTTSQSQYQTNILTGVNALQSAGTCVILVVPYPIYAGSTMESGSTPFWSQYRTALDSIATSNNVPVLDLHTYYVSEAALSTAGWINSDGIHGNDSLYADIGNIYAQLLMSMCGNLA